MLPARPPTHPNMQTVGLPAAASHQAPLPPVLFACQWKKPNTSVKPLVALLAHSSINLGCQEGKGAHVWRAREGWWRCALDADVALRSTTRGSCSRLQQFKGTVLRGAGPRRQQRHAQAVCCAAVTARAACVPKQPMRSEPSPALPEIPASVGLEPVPVDLLNPLYANKGGAWLPHAIALQPADRVTRGK